jgi:hypothetical protein
MNKLVKFDSLGLCKIITDRPTDATQVIGALTHFIMKYLKMTNRITFGTTTAIIVYGIMRTCMLKATDLLSIKLFHTRVTYTEIVSM